jgi:hypothetical protein
MLASRVAGRVHRGCLATGHHQRTANQRGAKHHDSQIFHFLISPACGLRPPPEEGKAIHAMELGTLTPTRGTISVRVCFGLAFSFFEAPFDLVLRHKLDLRHVIVMN